MRRACLVLVFLAGSVPAMAQPHYDYSRPFLATSQLGFTPLSSKEVSFFAGALDGRLPEEIPFYITRVGYRLPRQTRAPEAWGKTVFRWPFDIDEGPYVGEGGFAPGKNECLYVGVLRKVESRWGTLWRGDFSDFRASGTYQIENRWAFTAPFEVSEIVYERLERNFLEFLYAQRSGMAIPGVRPLENADDAVLDTDPDRFLPVAGGWNDAGDWRKWLFLTLPNLDALAQVAEAREPRFPGGGARGDQVGQRLLPEHDHRRGPRLRGRRRRP